MSTGKQDHMEDIIKEEKEKMEKDFNMMDWIFENHNQLVNEFVEDNSEQFKLYCQERYKEVKK
jgi:hypothetical protein